MPCIAQSRRNDVVPRLTRRRMVILVKHERNKYMLTTRSEATDADECRAHAREAHVLAAFAHTNALDIRRRICPKRAAVEHY
eukprot:7213743-Prymnesium_polylepis.1